MSKSGDAATRLGKWGDPDFPKGGWALVGVEDLGPDERETCEMCKTASIRYVHRVRHWLEDDLQVGCVCCGHMIGDRDFAQRAEDDERLRSDRIARLVASKRWREDAHGGSATWGEHSLKVRAQAFGERSWPACAMLLRDLGHRGWRWVIVLGPGRLTGLVEEGGPSGRARAIAEAYRAIPGILAEAEDAHRRRAARRIARAHRRRVPGDDGRPVILVHPRRVDGEGRIQVSRSEWVPPPTGLRYVVRSTR